MKPTLILCLKLRAICLLFFHPCFRQKVAKNSTAQINQP